MAKQALSQASGSETRNQKFTVFDTEIRFIEAGSFENEEHKTVDYPAVIKIKVPTSAEPVRISARSLTALYFLIHDSPELQTLLKQRCAVESRNDKTF